MSFDTDLVTGLAELLHVEQAGTWSPTAALVEGVTGIVAGAMPSQPSKLIALTLYPVADDPALSDATIGCQIKMRGDRNTATVADMAEAVFNVLHGLTHMDVGAPGARVHINQMYRKSYTDLGPDDSGRFERSENYWIEVNRPHPRLE
jgi:hypothetical protein